MQFALGGLIGIIFLYINAKILESDIKYKKIPNHYLVKFLYLLPFWYIYAGYFGYFGEIHVIIFILQIFLSFFIAFLLFHYDLWGAGDAKYLLVLSLFIPHISIISIIGSIAIITIIYLFLYFIWFWTGKNLFTKNTSVYKYLWHKKKHEIYRKKIILGKKGFYTQILLGGSLFIVFFIGIRLLRFYILEYIATKYNTTPYDIFIYILESPVNLFLLFTLCIIAMAGIFIFTKSFILRLQEKLGYDIQFGLLMTSFALLIPLIYLDFLHDPQGLEKKIILILTLYISIYIGIKILWSSYKIVFNAQEEENIHIEQLTAGMIIDKKDFIKNFGFQEALNDFSKDWENTQTMIQHIKNPLDYQDCNRIKAMYSIVEGYHREKNTSGYLAKKTIKTLKSFALSPYIFLGFCFGLFQFPRIFSDIISKILLNQ